MDAKEYWKNQVSSMNRSNDDAYYEYKCAEHLLVMKDANLSNGLIDYGYGDGLLLQKISQRLDCDIVGVDFSESLFEIASNLEYSKSTSLYLCDAIEYAKIAKGSVWMSCGAINQFSDRSQMDALLKIFDENKFATEIYFFDCIDPLRYWLVSYGVIDSYIFPKRRRVTLGRFIGVLRAGFLILSNFLSDKSCMPVSEMGYGFSPDYWLKISMTKGYNIRIISSQVFEYRYNVVIKKNQAKD